MISEMLVVHLSANDGTMTQLWDFDVIGITDMAREKQGKKEIY